MINFLRKIRMKLVLNGRMKKYVLYAIGEVVLIVFGILIALYLNNWNIQRNNDSKEYKIQVQLNEDYLNNLKQLEQKMKMRSDLTQAALDVLSMIDDSNSLNPDSLMPKLNQIIVDPTFDPIDNELMYTGDIRLIRNDSLKRMLSRWTSDVKQVQQVELEWQKIRTEIYIPFLIKWGHARNLSNEAWKDSDTPIHILDSETNDLNARLILGQSNFSTDTNDDLFVRELEGIMSMAINANHVANLQSISLRKRILKIIELIEKEIDRNT